VKAAPTPFAKMSLGKMRYLLMSPSRASLDPRARPRPTSIAQNRNHPQLATEQKDGKPAPNPRRARRGKDGRMIGGTFDLSCWPTWHKIRPTSRSSAPESLSGPEREITVLLPLPRQKGWPTIRAGCSAWSSWSGCRSHDVGVTMLTRHCDAGHRPGSAATIPAAVRN
jgi:hypothetical protein